MKEMKEWKHATLRERAPEVQPRERLAANGPQQLSEAELIGILLRTGLKGVTAVELANQLVDDFGGLAGLTRASFEELQKRKGMGPAKAAQLTAAFELGRRMARHLTEKGPEVQIKHSREAVDEFMPYLRGQTQEFFYALLIDIKLRPLKKPVLISKGGLDKTIAQPREAFQEAVKAGAAGVIFAHNHPSGDPTPSADDNEVTHRLEEAGKILGIRMLDHLIITDSHYYSFKHRGQE